MELSFLSQAPTSPLFTNALTPRAISHHSPKELPGKHIETYQTMSPGTPTRQSQLPLPPNISISPTNPTTLPAFRRVITLLLPIRYPDKFYQESVSNITSSSLSRVAIWLETPCSGKRKYTSTPPASPNERLNAPEPPKQFDEGRVVGGIQCRLEDWPSTSPGERKLYIQTIAVLSPYQHLGIATHLLNAMIETVIEHYEYVTSIYAHVWEASAGALEWYLRRGFAVQDEIVQDYYKRLRPRGARIVQRRIGVGDHLAMKKFPERNEEASGRTGNVGKVEEKLTVEDGEHNPWPADERNELKVLDAKEPEIKVAD